MPLFENLHDPAPCRIKRYKIEAFPGGSPRLGPLPAPLWTRKLLDRTLVTIAETETIEEAFRRLNANMLGILFAQDAGGRVVGAVTDGDIRRKLLSGTSIAEQVATCVNRNFVWALSGGPREQILKLLDQRVHVVPILDSERRLVDVFSRDLFQLNEESEVFARARSPVRISFSGGGTDLTHYFVDNDGGSVINATIAMYAHATLRRRNDGRIRIYSHDFKQTVEVDNLAALGSDGELALIKSVIRLIKPPYGFDLDVSADFPVGSGLGGSAVVSSAIIGCFNEFRSDQWDRHEIAEMAFQAERLMLNIPGGWQDQYATVFGGFNHMEFSSDQNTIVPLRLDSNIIAELEESLILCYTGFNHDSGSIHQDQKTQHESRDAVAAAARQKEVTREIRRHLLRGRLLDCGRLIDEAWHAKRRLSAKISSNELDAIYELAKANGAVGGKLLGAGGGGYFIFFVRPFERYPLITALEDKGLRCSRISFEENGLRTWKSRIPAESTQNVGNAARPSQAM
jgi:D-glycero-alpha-D-manno-heptose-7-phosphate kinase